MSPAPPNLVQAARQPEIHWALPVLVELNSCLDATEFRKIHPWRIAELLKVGQSSVYRAIDALERHGFLEKGPRNGNADTFRLRPVS